MLLIWYKCVKLELNTNMSVQQCALIYTFFRYNWDERSLECVHIEQIYIVIIEDSLSHSKPW